MTINKNVRITGWNQLSEIVLDNDISCNYIKFTKTEKSNIERLYNFCNMSSKISDLFSDVINNIFNDNVVSIKEFGKLCAENTDTLITGMLKELNIINK